MRPVRPTLSCARLGLLLLVLSWSSADLVADGWKVHLLGVKSMGLGLGGRAAVEDASAVWFNPAGMTRLDREWTITSGVPIITSALDYADRGSFSMLGQPLVGSPTSNGGSVNVVPHLYAARKVTDRLWIGGGFNAPAGLSSDYGKTWVGRYQATGSRLAVVNVSAVGAVRVNERLSLGIGLDVQRSAATLENQLDLGSLGASLGLPLTPQGHDGHLTLDATAWDVGYDLSLACRLSHRVRVALTYRSRLDHGLEGTATFDLPPEAADLAATGAFRSTTASATLPMPQELSAGIAVNVSDRWTVVGDLMWTDWSHYRQLVITFENPVQAAIVQDGYYRDTARGSVGVMIRASGNWIVRGGAFYDDSPVPVASRTPRLPEADNLVFTAGATYRLSRAWDLDFGWSHLIPHDAALRSSDPAAGLLNGSVRSRSDVLAFGVSMAF